MSLAAVMWSFSLNHNLCFRSNAVAVISIYFLHITLSCLEVFVSRAETSPPHRDVYVTTGQFDERYVLLRCILDVTVKVLDFSSRWGLFPCVSVSVPLVWGNMEPAETVTCCAKVFNACFISM